MKLVHARRLVKQKRKLKKIEIRKIRVTIWIIFVVKVGEKIDMADSISLVE